jgi:hypothetical protein
VTPFQPMPTLALSKASFRADPQITGRRGCVLRSIATPNANNRPIRIQPAVLKPQSGLSSPLSGSTEKDGKSVELVPVPVVVLVLVVALACALAVETRVCVERLLPAPERAVALERPRIRNLGGQGALRGILCLAVADAVLEAIRLLVPHRPWLAAPRVARSARGEPGDHHSDRALLV